MNSLTHSAHPALEPLDYQLSPEKAAHTMQGDLLAVYSLLWSAAVASSVDGPALRQQLLDVRLFAGDKSEHDIPDLLLQAVQEHCVESGWRQLLTSEGGLADSEASVFLQPFAPALSTAIDEIGVAQRGPMGTRFHSMQACTGLTTLLPSTEHWRASKVVVHKAALSLDQLIEQMAQRGVGRPSTFASTVQRALRNELIAHDGEHLHIGGRGREILDDMARHSQIGALDASYSEDLEAALKNVEQDAASAGTVLDAFTQRALGQTCSLSGWLDGLMIEGESLSQAMARADACLPSANSWEAQRLPSGLSPQLLTREPECAARVRESVDRALAHGDHLGWKRLSARERAACRTAVLELCDGQVGVEWPVLVSRDIAWRCWVDLGPDQAPFNDHDLRAARQRIERLPEDVRMQVTLDANTVRPFI